MVMRPDRFTEQAQEALNASQQLVRELRHTQWDVEHVLLALLELEKGVPVEVLLKLGVPLEAMKQRVEETLEQIPKTTNEASLVYVTPKATKLLENAKAEAERFKDEFIGA